MMNLLKLFSLYPWYIICKIFELGKFGKWTTEFPTSEDPDYNIEPWQSFGHGNHSTCDRNWCPFKCEKGNF